MTSQDGLTPIHQAYQAIDVLIDKILALKASMMHRMEAGHPTPTPEHYQAALDLTLDTVEFACEVKQATGGESGLTQG